MINRYAKSHIISILTGYEPSLVTNQLYTQPLDRFIRQHLNSHKNISSTDRKLIQGYCFEIMRYKVLLDQVANKPLSWQNRLDSLLQKEIFNKQKTNLEIEQQIRSCLPLDLYNIMSDQFGQQKAYEYGKVFIERAPLTIRTNTQKISRNRLFDILKKNYKYLVKKTEHSLTGIMFMSNQNVDLINLKEFKQGLFEIQDESSQLVCQRIMMSKNSTVLDYCAGSGGKSLAIADILSGIGQVYLHDTRKNALLEAKKRMLRAGYQNFNVVDSISNLNKKFDYLLLDVPCSGSGTYRRNPDLKHKFNKDNLKQLTILQRKIIRDSIRFLKPDGHLVYVTCSLFQQENMEQVYQICQNYGMKVKDDKVFQILPESNQMDCLFQAILKFK